MPAENPLVRNKGFVVQAILYPLVLGDFRGNIGKNSRKSGKTPGAPCNLPCVVPAKKAGAVVFDSDLFHETDTIHFKPGYENRRINITLLFGRRQTRRQ
jgi:hypothetical protein